MEFEDYHCMLDDTKQIENLTKEVAELKSELANSKDHCCRIVNQKNIQSMTAQILDLEHLLNSVLEMAVAS